MYRRNIGLALGLLLAGTVSATAQNYGAIAYAPDTGGYGYSYDYGSRGAAELRALAECQASSRGCVVALWFQNACGAVAAGPRGWGSGWGSDQRRADLEAIKVCNQYSGGCTIQVQVCTSR